MDDAREAFAEASGTIATRFESQKTVDEARERKDRQWKEAYARLGQEPPPKPEEPVDDGKTLFERLQNNKDAKREEWDNKMKLSNQYRGLNTEEMQFLSDKAKERREEERKVEEQEAKELREYRERLAAKNAASLASSDPSSSAGPSQTSKPAEPRKPLTMGKPKKDVKSLMKGIVVKKKPKQVSVTSKDAGQPAISPLTGTPEGVTGVSNPAKSTLSTANGASDSSDAKDEGAPASSKRALEAGGEEGKGKKAKR